MPKSLVLDAIAASAHEGIPVFWVQPASLLAWLQDSGTVPWAKLFQSVSAPFLEPKETNPYPHSSLNKWVQSVAVLFLEPSDSSSCPHLSFNKWVQSVSATFLEPKETSPCPHRSLDQMSPVRVRTIPWKIESSPCPYCSLNKWVQSVSAPFLEPKETSPCTHRSLDKMSSVRVRTVPWAKRDQSMSSPFLEPNDFSPCPHKMFLDNVFFYHTPPDIISIKYKNQNVITSVLVLLTGIRTTYTVDSSTYIFYICKPIVNNFGLLFTGVRVLLMFVGYCLQL